MHQGYHRDAEGLNAQLERYAGEPRFQEVFIDLVCNAFNKIIVNRVELQKRGLLTCFPTLSNSKMSRGYIANIFTCYQGFYSFSCNLNVFGIRRPFDGFFQLLAILSHYLSPFRSDSGYWQIVEEA